MSHKRGILIALVAIGLMLASISCATAQVPPQQSPTESVTPTPTTSQTPLDLNTLTDADKAKAIEIVLNTPEAKGVLRTYTTYKADFNSVAIVWEGSVIKERLVDMRLHFGEIEPGYPEGRVLLDVTVDLVNEKTVGLVVTHPLKKLPVP